MDQVAERDGRGRFQPGQSGNPMGRPPGSLNRATVLRGCLRDGEHETAARVVIDQACGGDAVAARLLLDRLEPRPRGRPLPLELSPDAPLEDGYRALFRAFAAGDISPDEALAGARFLDRLADRAATIERLERENVALRAALEARRAAPVADVNSTCNFRSSAAVPAAAAPADSPDEPVTVAPPDPPPPAIEHLNPTCIFRPSTGAAAAPPDPAPPPSRRRSAMRYWAGKPPQAARL